MGFFRETHHLELPGTIKNITFTTNLTIWMGLIVRSRTVILQEVLRGITLGECPVRGHVTVTCPRHGAFHDPALGTKRTTATLGSPIILLYETHRGKS